jgi:prolyl oligopeptidase
MNISSDYINEYYKINPTINDFFLKEEWNKKSHIQPNIYSEDYYKKLNDLDKKYFKLLNKKECLSFEDKLLYNNLDYDIHLEEDYEIYMYIPINSMNNLLFDYISEANGNGSFIFEKREDYDIFLQRIKSLTPITDELIKKMKNGIKNKVTLYRGEVNQMINNIKEVLASKLYYKKKVLISRKKWDEEIDKYLVNNLNKLMLFLINEYFEHTDYKFGLQKYKGGKKLYKKIVEYNTYKGLTPEEIHKIGLKELTKLKKEKYILELNYKQKKTFKNKKEILDYLKKLQKRTIEEVHNKNFHGKINKKDLYKIKSIPKENERTFAYYISPDMKNKRKGTFYIDTSSPSTIDKNELYVLSLHEGIPGHHYQINYKIKYSDLSDYRKVTSYNSYSEGWALYCENMGKYNKKNLDEYYHKVKYDMHRCVRLVIDTGIHYFGWSYDKCFKFMKDNLQHKDVMVHKEILRYNNLPGQALTYKIGEKTFLYLKNKYLKKGGKIKDFHQIIMEVGPCPLDMLVDIFIKNKLI